MGLFDRFKKKNNTENFINYKNWNVKNKFSVLDNQNNLINFEYGNLYEVEHTPAYNRIIIGPSNAQINLLLKIADTFNPPYYILYVLLLSHNNNKIGRYQSPILNTKEELHNFILDYKEYFETDGRHHIWIGTADNSGLLIYDQHNIIYAYGRIDLMTDVLKKEKYKEGKFSFPVPHVHGYHTDNDKFEDKIFKEFDWQHFPLQENDLYD